MGKGSKMNTQDKIQTQHASYLLGPQPKVTLLHATPEWVVAQATKGYEGVYTAEPMTEEEQARYFKELGETALKGPLEMATTFWLIEAVTRGFTHQLARYRIGTSEVQESMRFSIQDASRAQIMVPPAIGRDEDGQESFIDIGEAAMDFYNTSIANGVPTEDARAILPTNICTRLYLSVNVKALVHIYRQRSCCQAQHGEWGSVIRQMREELINKGFRHYAYALLAPWEDKNCITCGFGANFDRPCKHAHLFEANLDAAYWDRK